MADSEVEAMGKVAEALSVLEQEERVRVLKWAADRYGVVVAAARRAAGASEVAAEEGVDDAGDGSGGNSGFDSFAELYDAVSPHTDAERVLVSCYWVQTLKGKDSFGSQELNVLLKDLGHAVSAINKAMSSNINKKPALILQMARGGSTQQARKKYKLSAAGKKWVEDRLKQ